MAKRVKVYSRTESEEIEESHESHGAPNFDKEPEGEEFVTGDKGPLLMIWKSYLTPENKSTGFPPLKDKRLEVDLEHTASLPIKLHHGMSPKDYEERRRRVKFDEEICKNKEMNSGTNSFLPGEDDAVRIALNFLSKFDKQKQGGLPSGRVTPSNSLGRDRRGTKEIRVKSVGTP